jgi:hypothetical protein
VDIKKKDLLNIFPFSFYLKKFIIILGCTGVIIAIVVIIVVAVVMSKNK